MDESETVGNSLVENLQFITLYIYEGKFLLEPNVKATSINTNLVIDRRKHGLEEISSCSPTQASLQRSLGTT